MSEELLQTKPHQLDRYLYWKLGNSTLTQLKQAKIIPVKQITAKLASKRPDGLIVSPNAAIKAVIEYKTPTELSSQSKINKAIAQEIEVAKSLCKLLIVSDGEKSFWINALTGQQITDENGEKLKTFSAKKILEGQLTAEEILRFEQLLDQIEHSLTEQNDTLTAPALIDPSMLAKTIWQKIWINTGKNPEQCLYNVVELFVFKFLSDVGVLEVHNNFDYVYSIKTGASSKDALEHYARICRKKIRELFPQSPTDRTTIINGTIFVNERGEPNSAQARLFGEVLDHLQKYTERHGSFKNIQREFKTRLYESFLRQEAGVKSLGQYFTPRNVVRAMVDMSSAATLQPGTRICDPFCGVGGFVLETIAANPHIYREFEPRNGVVSPRFTLRGYDKGTDEKEDERTIILAKANMLIYFSDLLSRFNSPEHLKAFSEGAFNSVFHLLRSNLGTFSKIDDEPYDLILTNPPYVTSGSNSLKRAIEEEGLSSHYTSGGRGTESLALEWIVRHLNFGGQALVVVPDGLLNQTAILKYLKENCLIRAVVSLPSRTFYSTPKRTYILILTRKHRNEEVQIDPVFTYIVSEIGESRDAKRFKIDENDLDEATGLYNQFKGSPRSFVSHSKRCKVVTFEDFQKYPHWMIDRFWDRNEKQELGIVDEETEISEEELHEIIRDAKFLLEDVLMVAQNDQSSNTTEGTAMQLPSQEVFLGDNKLFEIGIGKRVLKKDVVRTGIPIYSSNVLQPFGYASKTILEDFSTPFLLWGIDGTFDWNLIPENTPFMPTDHCGVLRVLHPRIDPRYVYHVLRATKERYGFDRTFRASLTNIKAVNIPVPVKDGEYDVEAQIEIANKYEKVEQTKQSVVEALLRITDSSIAL